MTVGTKKISLTDDPVAWLTERTMPIEDCIAWMRWVDHLGYGYTTVDRRRVPAHRLAYEILVGPIPDGLVIDHLCRVPCCVKPQHLEPVTQEENFARRKKRPTFCKTQCSRGHWLFENNVYYYKNRVGNVARRCRTCTLAYEKERYAKRERL